MADKVIARLRDCEELTLAQVGGKFLRLARLTTAGFTVPPAFCICATALRIVLGNDAPTSQQALQSFILRALETDFPSTLAAAIYKHLDELTPPFVVRSSATSEDDFAASFAGMFTSIVGVHRSEVLAAVRQCWASLWSDRARSYMANRGDRFANAGMAVICQELVNASAGGVLFTSDPVAQQPFIVINSTWGLPIPVVDGTITPDLFVLSRDGTVREQRVGTKRRIALWAGERLITRAATTAESSMLSLTPLQLRQLVNTGLAIEDLFHAPQDIEWAYCGDSLLVVQARPITTATL